MTWFRFLLALFLVVGTILLGMLLALLGEVSRTAWSHLRRTRWFT